MKQKVTVFGSAVVDLMARTPHLPARARRFAAAFSARAPAAGRLNQAVAAGKAGGDVTMVMKLGRDSLAEVPLAAMREAGLPTDYVFITTPFRPASRSSASTRARARTRS